MQKVICEIGDGGVRQYSLLSAVMCRQFMCTHALLNFLSFNFTPFLFFHPVEHFFFCCWIVFFLLHVLHYSEIIGRLQSGAGLVCVSLSLSDLIVNGCLEGRQTDFLASLGLQLVCTSDDN